MLGALEAEGTVIGVLADSLLRACSSAKYREYLMANNLVLISTFYPEAGFNAGNAMQRNKYIYCLSDAALVVQSGTKGGTWSGAMENLNKQWVPLWVKRTSDNMSGNSAIEKAGAAWVSGSISEVDFTALFSSTTLDTGADDDLFNRAASGIKEDVLEYSPETQLESEPNPSIDGEAGAQREAIIDQASEPEGSTEQGVTPSSAVDGIEFYDLFLMKIQVMCSDSAKTPDELVDMLELNKTQLNAWLKRAVAEKKLKKLSKPVRYQWLSTQQGALFL